MGTLTPHCSPSGCTDDIVTSDHSPVFASFEVGVTSQFVSKKGLSKSSEQAHIEFESIEAIVKTSSRTKFFIEFYSTCLEEFKKSFENDAQSSDNINFLKVQWSSRQLPTLKPILSDIEYLQDQHLLLTVKSLDGYESYGECVIALKSMIGSTAQQFLTFLSHRGEETGNIRGCMRVRVPAERLGTRERLYEWISIDKDEAAASKGKVPLGARATQDCARSSTRKPAAAADPSTIPKPAEEPEQSSTIPAPRPPAPHRRDEPAPSRPRPDPEPLHTSFNNPAYYVLEGVPQRRRASSPPAPRDGSSEDEDALNLPPPDFPPPPLPRDAATEPPGREEPRPRPGPTEGLPPRLQPGPDGSCSVLQMAKSLSEEEFGAGPRLPHEHGRAGAAFRTHPIRESIQEELAEEAVGAGGAVGVWLRALGLQRYEQGLVHNGWDDLEFLSDITEEDLEEAGVRDPGHKRVLLESLQLRK
ncbi:phosphatidylinositol 3,4,5-trisphosphate 5-phosphatase 2-like [Pezoporus occidentalis]|uniref:phosphatidylinositol 3,4,5-trisphosphate 5-phosphatase 2-like n=1 Tax=Pezoporus occidentalis TaxID=407982 RepID=UPI002F90C630